MAPLVLLESRSSCLVGDLRDGVRPFPVACTVGAPLPLAITLTGEVAERLSPLVLCDREHAVELLANF